MTVIINEDVYISHYGVKGMRWGVRKERDSSRKSVSSKIRDAAQNREAKKAEAQASIFQKRIDGIDAKLKTTSNPYLTRSLSSRKKMAEEQRDYYLSEAQKAKEGKLTDRQKKALKTAAVVGGVLAAYGLYSMAQSGELHQLKLSGERFLKGTKSVSWKKQDWMSSKDLDVDQIMLGIVRPINKGFGAPGTKVNCRRCTFAYEMRRRGFDVAATKTTNGKGQDITGLLNAVSKGKPQKGGLIFMYKYAKESVRANSDPLAKTPFKDIVDGKAGPSRKISGGVSGLFRELSMQPNGARGEVAVSWDQGGGHSVAWEIIKGKPYIFDTQSGKKFSNDVDLVNGFPSIKDISLTRLDNLELNDKFLQRWLKDA